METVVIFSMIIVYKIAGLFAGLAICYMGYKLFLADKVKSAGSVTAGADGLGWFKITGGAPGLFFTALGTSVLVFTLLKDISYTADAATRPTAGIQPEIVIPETLPPTFKGSQ